MNRYNPNIHHRRSIRLKGYDYSQAGLYFITICCQNRACLFGEIAWMNGIHHEMILNEFGQIAFDEWIKTPELRKNVELHEFVIMPNHIHGIIRLLGRGELNTPDHSIDNLPDGENECNSHIQTNVRGECNSNMETNIRGECNSPLRSPSQTIGSIVRGYKSSVTKQINNMGVFDIPVKIWQRNYYGHIIRHYKQSHKME